MQKAISTTFYGYRAYAWIDRKGTDSLCITNIRGDRTHEPRNTVLSLPPRSTQNDKSFCLVSSYRPAQYTPYAYALLYDGDDIRILAGCREWGTLPQARKYYEHMKKHNKPKAVASLRCIKELEIAYRAEVKKRAALFMKNMLRVSGLD